ncbi:MAG: radical SAM protein [Deltaproteobacteria bacterium]|jgi:radical SAM protein with 4Fe4S-binding SPASM domain
MATIDSGRRLTEDDWTSPFPAHAVWEITLACDLECNHCGSRAARRRPDELSTAECLDVVTQLAALGCREVTLIGGEAYLRKDWTTLIRAVADAGMLPGVQTGARNLTEKRVAEAAEAGLRVIGVSIDGLAETHDAIRGVPGSFDKAITALETCKRYGMELSVNTQIHSSILGELPAMLDRFIEIGIATWQIQLTVAMGRAADNDALLVQPYELLEIYPVLFELWEKAKVHGIDLIPGNNIGYFGPYEHAWRGRSEFSHFKGCNAGLNTLGIEADGTIKGCPSLPTTPFSGGNIRDLSLEDIWNDADALAFNRTRTTADLWGRCQGCYYADVCRAGCTWTTHTLFGRSGNNPYCHYRALKLAEEGLRERIVKVRAAPGQPFDYGGFELIEERIDDGAEVKRIAAEPRHTQVGHPRLVVLA